MRRTVKVAGSWRYLYQAINQFGQVVDVFLYYATVTRRGRLAWIEVRDKMQPPSLWHNGDIPAL